MAQSAGPWFGGFRSREPNEDYRLYWEAFRGILRRAQNEPRPEFGHTVAGLVHELEPIVRYSAEWSEALMDATADFALGAPEAYVLYLADLPVEHRRKEWGRVHMLCETDGAKRLSDSLTELVRTARLEPAVSAVAVETIAYLNQGCAWPPQYGRTGGHVPVASARVSSNR